MAEPIRKRRVILLAEECPAEQAVGNEQERENGRDQARGDVLFGHVNGVEVDDELEETECSGDQDAARRKSKLLTLPTTAPPWRALQSRTGK